MGLTQAIILESRPFAQYHFGEYSIDDTRLNHTSLIPHADTIFSAIINIYNRTFSDTDDFITALELYDLQISSGCYCLRGDNGSIFFLPKPQVLGILNNTSEDFKKQKKVLFVSKSVWERGINPDLFLTDDTVLLGNKFVCTNKEIKEIKKVKLKAKFHTELSLANIGSLTKNRVHTDKQENTLYTQSNLQIQDLEQFGLSVHFYFLLKHDLPVEWKKKLDLVISLLPEFGLGGERSTGCGKFWGVSAEEFTINPLKPSATFLCSASLISPYNLDELNRINYYSTVIRGGRRLGSDENAGYKLQQIRMIKEGALVKNDLPIGHNPSIKPQGSQDEYLRYGKGFLLPIHENWTKQWQG
ncbi:type III-A CRISPR-associated RAMP protein Csm4 [Flectobacillus roseus]|uniref:CRISPR system Cms protein Csm4 n=1 Tax=Flectobacillus roseus TaxID=502259 RepID=A0ABT6Y6R0_9BACT|nr:type III-A CRISPR-associated RAMP protein Csm4 [Flectobacillus roseus]MDI9858941.1 type III-A CRISPR-associated RAMP protein Csm4 [Flectobacillus roseus]